MSYKAFLEQYKGRIVRRIIKDKGWSITKAYNYLAAKFMGDDYIYSIMNDIIREEEPKLIINRNPTITWGSIILMKIRSIKQDANDVTLSIPSAILPGQLAAHPLI